MRDVRVGDLVSAMGGKPKKVVGTRPSYLEKGMAARLEGEKMFWRPSVLRIINKQMVNK